MKKTIFERFYYNKKWLDYVNLRSFEVKFSLITTLLLISLFFHWDFYKNFKDFIPAIQNISIYVATALIGMLGIILAGLAIIIGVLNRKVLKSIERLNNEKSIYNILVSFEFLAFNIGVAIFIFYALYLALYSSTAIFSELAFYIISFGFSYLFLFIISYTISLISNSIRVFYIANLYEDIKQSEKSLIDIANELRIDYILGQIIKVSDKKKFIEDLMQYVDRSNVQDKEHIKEYLKSYYDK